MAISDAQLYILDKLASIAGNTPLGTLIRAAETGAPADASITKAKLASGVQPSHIAVFAGTFTTVGGAATEAHTVTGAATADIAVVTLNTAGGSPVTIKSSKVSATNTLQVIFSGDPAADHVVNYVILRATT